MINQTVLIDALNTAKKTASGMIQSYILEETITDPSVDLDILDEKLEAIPRVNRPFVDPQVFPNLSGALRQSVSTINAVLFAYCLLADRYLDEACNAIRWIITTDQTPVAELLEAAVDIRGYNMVRIILQKTEDDDSNGLDIEQFLSTAFPKYNVESKNDPLHLFAQDAGEQYVEMLKNYCIQCREEVEGMEYIDDLKEEEQWTLKDLQRRWHTILASTLRASDYLDVDEEEAEDELADDDQFSIPSLPSANDEKDATYSSQGDPSGVTHMQTDDDGPFVPSPSVAKPRARRNLPGKRKIGSILNEQQDAVRLTHEDFEGEQRGEQSRRRRRPPRVVIKEEEPTKAKLHKVHIWWTNEELDAISVGLRRFKGPQWLAIKDSSGDILKNRTNVQIKDKARTELRRRINEGIPLDEYSVLLK